MSCALPVRFVNIKKDHMDIDSIRQQGDWCTCVSTTCSLCSHGNTWVCVCVWFSVVGLQVDQIKQDPKRNRGCKEISSNSAEFSQSLGDQFTHLILCQALKETESDREREREKDTESKSN